MIVSTNKQEHNNMNEFTQNQTPFGFTPNKSRMASNYGTQGFISQSSKLYELGRSIFELMFHVSLSK